MIRDDLTRPSTTISVVGVVGAICTLGFGVLDRIGVVLSADEGTAVATLLMFVIGYAVRDPVMRKQLLEELRKEAKGE